MKVKSWRYNCYFFESSITMPHIFCRENAQEMFVDWYILYFHIICQGTKPGTSLLFRGVKVVICLLANSQTWKGSYISPGDTFTFPTRKQSREDKCLAKVIPGQELDSGLPSWGVPYFSTVRCWACSCRRIRRETEIKCDLLKLQII